MMKRKFTLLAAALMLLSCLAVPLGMRGQTRDVKTVTYTWNSTNRAFEKATSTGDDVDQITPTTTTTGTSQSAAGPSGNQKPAVQLMKPNNGNPRGTFTFTLNSFPYVVNGISFNYYTTSGDKSGSMTATLDDEAFASYSTDISSNTSWSDQALTVSGTSEGNENLVVSANYTTNSVYVHSLTITYTTGSVTPTVATPTFDPDGGVYSSTQSVVISSTDDDVDIYYTTDGTDPSESSTAIEYTSPVQISDHTTLKAVATADYEEYSAIATAEYKFLPTLDVVVPADNPTYVYNNVQSFSWYVLSGATTHGTTITEKGFVYSTTNNSPTTADTKIVVTGDDLEATLTGLAASTSYYVRSYAISEGQTVYSATATTLTTPAFPTYDIQFVVNGESYGDMVSVSGVIGEVINTQPAANLIPEGYTFAGWSSEDETINIINGTYAPTDDMFLYAVFSITEYGEPVTNYQRVTVAPSDWSGDYLIVCENSQVVFNGALGTLDAPHNVISVSIDNHTIAPTNTLDAATFTISTITNSSWYSIKNNDNKYIGANGGNNGLTVSDTELSNVISLESDGGKIVIQGTKDGNTVTKYLRFNSQNDNNNYRFRFYSASTGQNIQFYKKITTTPSVTKQYTRIMDVTTTATRTNIPVTYKVTVKNNGVLTLTGANQGDETNLIIEDGGQLITNNVIEATIQKNISAYDPTLTGVGVSNGWYFISSPLNSNGGWGYIPTEVNNLIPNNVVTSDQYDLYLFDPNEDLEWVNYKAHQGENEFLLYNGHGYLYANANNVTLEFAGSLNDPEPEISLENGWNLVGNPYAYNAYPSVSYYKMNAGGTAIDATEYTTADAIAPCTGILVDNSDEDEPYYEITFSKNAPTPAGGGAKGGINLGLAKNERGAAPMDNAIVSFNEGSQLGKFYFGHQNANIYIPQGNKEYAIVNVEAQGEMPVNFRANENGQYTLTVNPENVDMNYLHLIDNMTGMDVDLLQTPSYTFNSTTRDYESRFRLVFAANNEDGVSTGSTAFAFYSNGNWIINNAGEATLQVIDLTGRILSSETVNGSVSTTINAVPGVYMLRLINGENVNVQKIVVR